jgi:hypothetical protein
MNYEDHHMDQEQPSMQSKGGKARAQRMTPEQRSKSASVAARARWKPNSRKKQLIQAFADYLVFNQAGKSMALEMERRTLTPIHWAKEWAMIRQVSGVHGYPTVEAAIKHLTRILK